MLLNLKINNKQEFKTKKKLNKYMTTLVYFMEHRYKQVDIYVHSNKINPIYNI